MINNQNNTIIFKHTNIKGRTPTKDDIVVGEIAINTHSGSVYSIDDAGNVFMFGERTTAVFNAKNIITQDGEVTFGKLNDTMTLRGSKGCRTEANANTNTIDVVADTVDAIKLGGQFPCFYSAATHLHDDRYAVKETKVTSVLAGAKWYRIATATSSGSVTRAAATFDVSTTGHYVQFNAVGQNAATSVINVLNGYRTGAATLANTRIVLVGNVVSLDIYLDLPAAITVSMHNDASFHNGWTLIEPIATETGGMELVVCDISSPYGFDTSGEIREKGQRVFSPNNKPNWADVIDPPATMPPSEHHHDNLYYTETEIDAKFNEILDGASEQLNSFKELSDALLDNSDAIGALNDAIALKASKSGDTFTGDVKFDAGLGVKLTQAIRFNSADTGLGWGVAQATDGTLSLATRNDTGAWANKAYFDTTGQLFVVGDKQVFHQGFMGASSGLDADLLDGKQGSYYQNASNISDGTLAIARLTGVYNIGISGTAKTALDANNAVNLNDEDASYYLNADNINAGTLPVGRLSGAYNINVSGNAASADKLSTARSVILSGDVLGSADFDGSENITINTVISNDSHTHDGRYYTEVESDLRFAAVAKSGDTHSLISKDTTLLVSPPSDYVMGVFNEIKRGYDVGLKTNDYCSVVTIAKDNTPEQDGSYQLLHQNNTLSVRHGTRASGWNDPAVFFTSANPPIAADIGLNNVNNFPISNAVDLNDVSYYASAKAVHDVNAKVTLNTLALGLPTGALSVPTGTAAQRPVTVLETDALLRYTHDIGFEGYNPQTGQWGELGGSSENERVLVWNYVAVGGEREITPPFEFTSVRVYLQGFRQSEGYSYSVIDGVIKLTNALVTNELVEIELGIAPDKLSFDVLNAAKEVAENTALVVEKTAEAATSASNASTSANEAKESALAAEQSAVRYPEIVSRLVQMQKQMALLHPLY